MEFTLSFGLLDLSHNNFKQIKGSFNCYPLGINNLKLDHNKIEFIDPAEFIYKIHMKELHLNNNSIQALGFLLKSQGLTEVVALDISNNNLTIISQREIQALKSIKNVTLTNNPWICSCEEKNLELMLYLIKEDEISCCPEECQCEADVKKMIVFVGCRAKNKSALLVCLPYNSYRAELDYSENLLSKLVLHQNLISTSRLNLAYNNIQSINGTFLPKMTNLVQLNLTSNRLQKLPREIKDLKNTKIFIEGNQFDCESCSQVDILDTIKKSFPQQISCQDNQSFVEAETICLLEFKILPSVAGSLLAVGSIFALYFVLRNNSVRRRKEEFNFKIVNLSSKKSRHEFQNERTFQRKLDHPNVLRLSSYTTMWIPQRIGILFYEKTDCSLRERLQRARMGDLITNKNDLIKQLLSALEHIHTGTLCHLQLTLDKIFVKDGSDGACAIKIGDFSKAQFVTPTNEVEDVTSALVDVDDSVNTVSPNVDMEASANIIFSILTSEEKEVIREEDLEIIPEVEYRVLILALQNGLSAPSALISPAFDPIIARVVEMGKLNEMTKEIYARNQEKVKAGEPTDDTVFNQLEENAELVIGGQGAWFEELDPPLQQEYGMFGTYGYVICFVIELLRLTRNIFAHSNQNPDAMEKALGTNTPSHEQIYEYFSKKFSFFYLHTLYVYRKTTQIATEFEQDIYLKLFKAYETRTCMNGKASADILSLRKTNQLQVKFQAEPEPAVVSLSIDPDTDGFPYTVLPGKQILPIVYAECKHIWPDMPTSLVNIKDSKGERIHHGSRVLEGSTIQVVKLELIIRVPQLLIDSSDPADPPMPLQFNIEFKNTTNVRAIKGLVISKLPPDLKKKVNAKKVTVSFKGLTLNLTQNLASLESHLTKSGIIWEEGDIIEATFET
jgi:hypothetical protein